jgi:hypothetical protein
MVFGIFQQKLVKTQQLFYYERIFLIFQTPGILLYMQQIDSFSRNPQFQQQAIYITTIKQDSALLMKYI